MKTLAKYILRLLIEITQIFVMICWCFFIGTFYCLLYFIVGIMAGITQGEWSYFIIGLIGCVGHVLFIPMIWLYKYLFKKDDWIETTLCTL